MKRKRFRLGRKKTRYLFVPPAWIYRNILAILGVYPIGVTGSTGKTTTVRLLGAVIACLGKTKSFTTRAHPLGEIARQILQIRPSDRYWVQEMATGTPGYLAKLGRLVKPQMAVITNVGFDHYSSFHGREAIALEKRTLAEILPKDGVAVLNIDDDYVGPMKDHTRARVVSYGLDSSADVSAIDVSSAYPDSLSFKVIFRGKEYPIKTGLFGVHWVSSFLAAIAAGTSLGVPIRDAINALENITPTPGRLFPEITPDQITFIRDDWKATFLTIDSALEFLAQAAADRKIFVLGSMSDFPGKSSRKYRQVVRKALEVAEQVYVIGRWAESALKIQTAATENRLFGFPSVREAGFHMRDNLRAGDLVLLKGNITDHLQRLILIRTGEIECWREHCNYWRFCTDCEFQYIPHTAK